MSSPGVVSRVRTLLALGVASVARVLWYRMRVRAGVHPVQRIKPVAIDGPFFRAALPSQVGDSATWTTHAHYFGWYTTPLSGDAPPDWFCDPFTGVRAEGVDLPWWRLPDFNSATGDIKAIWELSRFHWALAMASRGETARLNEWLADWLRHNPPFRGPNWKCGQEASIRVIHLAQAADRLAQVGDVESALRSFIRLHLERIAPTTGYATGQDNNHGTSEAAALFVGGTWLRDAGHARNGRELLEERVAALVAPDGTFSQYSVTYHRLLLDTLNIAEEWRVRMGAAPFSNALYERARAARDWLSAMCDTATGDAPNLGPNDGVHLLDDGSGEYRDFRPCIARADAMFGPSASKQRPTAEHGFAVAHEGEWFMALRCANKRFRPPQADALHLDLWHRGMNLLRDAGTYSYAAVDDERRRFQGTRAHNTIEFDGRDQMPELGRFLYGEWLQPLSGGFGYRDWRGASHHRSTALAADGLSVTDRIDGFAQHAVLRWRLAPGDWQLSGTTVTGDGHALAVTSSMPIERCELVTGTESRYYLKQTPLLVLEVTVSQPGTLTTTVREI